MSVGITARRALLLVLAAISAALVLVALAGTAARPAGAYDRNDRDDLACYAVNQQDQLLRFDCDDPRDIKPVA